MLRVVVRAMLCGLMMSVSLSFPPLCADDKNCHECCYDSIRFNGEERKASICVDTHKGNKSFCSGYDRAACEDDRL